MITIDTKFSFSRGRVIYGCILLQKYCRQLICAPGSVPHNGRCVRAGLALGLSLKLFYTMPMESLRDDLTVVDIVSVLRKFNDTFTNINSAVCSITVCSCNFMMHPEGFPVISMILRTKQPCSFEAFLSTFSINQTPIHLDLRPYSKLQEPVVFTFQDASRFSSVDFLNVYVHSNVHCGNTIPLTFDMLVNCPMIYTSVEELDNVRLPSDSKAALFQKRIDKSTNTKDRFTLCFNDYLYVLHANTNSAYTVSRFNYIFFLTVLIINE